MTCITTQTIMLLNTVLPVVQLEDPAVKKIVDNVHRRTHFHVCECFEPGVEVAWTHADSNHLACRNCIEKFGGVCPIPGCAVLVDAAPKNFVEYPGGNRCPFLNKSGDKAGQFCSCKEHKCTHHARQGLEPVVAYHRGGILRMFNDYKALGELANKYCLIARKLLVYVVLSILLNLMLTYKYVKDTYIAPAPQQYMLGPATACNPLLQLGSSNDALKHVAIK